MNETLQRIKNHVAAGRVRLSRHGFKQLQERSIEYDEIVAGIGVAVVIEEYPEYMHGPCVLTLQAGFNERPLHVLWGMPKETMEFAVLVTAYRPDPNRWDETMTVRVRS